MTSRKNNKLIRFTILCVIWVASISVLPYLSEAEERLPDTLQTLFPISGEITGWTIEEQTFFVGNQIFDYMDGAGEIPRSYGFNRLCTTKYIKDDAVLEVAVFEMKDSAAAFGYYSVRGRTSNEEFVQLENGIRLVPGYSTITWKDRFTILGLVYKGKTSDDVLIQFAIAISGKLKVKGEMPDLIHYLPHDEFVSKSEKYIRGKAVFDAEVKFMLDDVFNLKNSDVEVAKGKYHGETGTYTLVLFRYIKPDDAAKSAQNFAAYIMLEKNSELNKKSFFRSDDVWVDRDTSGKFTGVFHHGQFAGIVLGAKDKRTAMRVLRKFRLEVSER